MGDTVTTQVATKKKKDRSPAYPGINLQTAIKRTDELYARARRGPASFPVASGYWGYKHTSSGALITVAALKSFGLVAELEPGPGGRNIQLSDLGARIVMDKRPGSAEREQAIKQAALTPKIHAALWKQYNGQLPPDSELQHRLLWDWKFNENSIPSFIKEFRDTIAFAKLAKSDTISGDREDSDEGELDDEELPTPKVGDWVQWESQGVLQLPEPKRIREVHEDGQWAFLEGSNTGVPMNQLTVVDPPAGAPPLPAAPPAPRTIVEEKPHFAAPPSGSGVLQDVFSLAEGTIKIQWPTPLSPDSFEDFSAWLDLLKRKIGRSVKKKEFVLGDLSTYEKGEE